VNVRCALVSDASVQGCAFGFNVTPVIKILPSLLFGTLRRMKIVIRSKAVRLGRHTMASKSLHTMQVSREYWYKSCSNMLKRYSFSRCCTNHPLIAVQQLWMKPYISARALPVRSCLVRVDVIVEAARHCCRRIYVLKIGTGNDPGASGAQRALRLRQLGGGYLLIDVLEFALQSVPTMCIIIILQWQGSVSVQIDLATQVENTNTNVDVLPVAFYF
jgi:hypothetical protein